METLKYLGYYILAAAGTACIFGFARVEKDDDDQVVTVVLAALWPGTAALAIVVGAKLLGEACRVGWRKALKEKK